MLLNATVKAIYFKDNKELQKPFVKCKPTQDTFCVLHYSGDLNYFCSWEPAPRRAGAGLWCPVLTFQAVSVLTVNLIPKLSATGPQEKLKPVAAPAHSGLA